MAASPASLRFVRVYNTDTHKAICKVYVKQRLNAVTFTADGPLVRSCTANMALTASDSFLCHVERHNHSLTIIVLPGTTLTVNHRTHYYCFLPLGAPGRTQAAQGQARHLEPRGTPGCA